VAAFNEAERLPATLAALRAAFPSAALFLADDGSTDATAQLARDAGAEVLSTGRVVGKGEAMTRALRAARRANPGEHETFLLCDGDLGDSAGLLGPLVEEVAAGRADLCVAAFARAVGGGFGVALGFARWAVRRRCGLRLHAPISGQRAISGPALDAVLPLARGFGMEIGMTIDAARAGFALAELELDLAHRATGRTAAGFLHRARQLFDFARAYTRRR
jgi:glycosyltransferase involved in cell wall biosynthesis